MAISYTETYGIITDGLADLGLDHEFQQRVLAATDALAVNTTEESYEAYKIRVDIDNAITAEIQAYGVTEDGEWLGEWSTKDIIGAILDAYGR